MLSSFVTFRVRRSRGEIYIGHSRLSLAAFPHYCTDPDVRWGNVRGVPSSCALFGGSVHGFRRYDNSAEREMSASACTPSMPVFLPVGHDHAVNV